MIHLEIYIFYILVALKYFQNTYIFRKLTWTYKFSNLLGLIEFQTSLREKSIRPKYI